MYEKNWIEHGRCGKGRRQAFNISQFPPCRQDNKIRPVGPSIPFHSMPSPRTAAEEVLGPALRVLLLDLRAAAPAARLQLDLFLGGFVCGGSRKVR